MTWAGRFRAREYIRGSLWVIPLAGSVLGGILGSGVLETDRAVDLPSYWQYSPATASTVLATIVGAMASLGVTEIREYGATSVQVMRRLRAMLDELGEEVLPEHRPAVLDEIARLDATVAAHWGRSVDLDRAGMADRQGMGGPTVHEATNGG